MKTENQKTMIKDLKLLGFTLWFYFFGFSLLAFLSDSVCLAVSSKIVRHSSSADLLKGQVEDIVIGSQGTIQLGLAADTLVEEFEGVGGDPNPEKDILEPWSINSIVVSGETVFVGTSPNGGVYKYSLGKLTKIRGSSPVHCDSSDELRSTSGEPNAVEVEQYLANEHIFAMATDVAGRLLVGISGEKCRLLRFSAGHLTAEAGPDISGEVIFVLGTPHGEPNDAKGGPPCGGTKYIFAIAIDDGGNIYLGTGPQGKLYRLDAFGNEPELVYDSRDKNILSLAIGRDGFVYAGSDSRGLVYKVDPCNKTATVLYDSDHPEITALLFAEDGDLYAAATSAKLVQAQRKFAAQLPLAGRPETKPEKGESAGVSEGELKLKIANTKKGTGDKPSRRQMPSPKKAEPGQASYIYKITSDGYVTDVFTQGAVFFCLAAQEQRLLVGTGNSAQLFTVEPASEQEAIVYEDEQASQITAVAVAGQDVYLGTANPAKLIKLGSGFASEGTYTSELIDAGQPAKWGKLQIEADIPDGCKVLVASRSGNVKDVNDPTFSDWTEAVEVTEPIQLRCPLGRFCQYKLVLQSEDGQRSPLVREIAVANTVPNLAPKVESVSISRIEAAGKTGVLKISYKAKDDNEDKLIYKIDFRKLGRTGWIELEEETEGDSFEWNGRTVEDGRYEIRVTTSDERGNSPATKLTGSRISEPVVVDNTGPMIEKVDLTNVGETVTLKLQVVDELSAIGAVSYTVDSNAEWKGVLPDDLVCDTTNEDFTIVIEDLESGEHIIAVRVRDDVGNTTYKSFEADLAGSNQKSDSVL